jgi:putative iron-only hydrogenase system regulator
MCKKGFFILRITNMAQNNEIRIAIIAIVIEDKSKSNVVNSILHEYADLFVGRLGIPFKEKKISVITLIAQGTNDTISALTGKLGQVKGITVNSMLTKKSQ